MKFCKNCGQSLTGKQRLYCSPKCKMQITRSNGNNTVTENTENTPQNTENQMPGNIFSLFGNDVLPMTPAALRHLKTHLLNEAKYSDDWIGRIADMPQLFKADEKLIAQQTLSKILWRMVDDLGELEDQR